MTTQPEPAVRVHRALVISVVAALVLYAGSSLFTGAEDVLRAVSHVDLRVWIPVLGLSLLNYLLRFCRWQWYLARLDHILPPLRHLKYYLAGFAFTTTPGKMGEAIRSLYLRPHGVGYADSLAALFVERFLDMLAMLLLGLLAGGFFSEVWWPVICAATLIAAIFTAVSRPGLQQGITARLNRSRSPRIQRFGGQVGSLMRSSEALLSPRMLVGGVMLGLIAWGAEGLGLYLILRGLEVQVTALAAIGVYAAGILIGALSFIPGGLGSTEAAMVVMLSVLGVDLSSAIAATIVCRVATLWFAVALGFCAFAGSEAGREGSLKPK
jgi:glycosyltransferase 2 family protein